MEENISLLAWDKLGLLLEVLSGDPKLFSKSLKLFLRLNDIFRQGKQNARRVSLTEFIYSDNFHRGLGLLPYRTQWRRVYNVKIRRWLRPSYNSNSFKSLGSITGVISVL